MSDKPKVAWIKTPNSLIVNYGGETHNVLKTDSGYEKILQAIKENKLEEIPGLVSLAKRVEKSSKGIFKVQNNQVVVNNVVVPPLLGERILDHEREGLPFEPLVKFAENLNLNPSYRSVQQLFKFLELNKHPVTDDGCFIAYKKVREDFKDVHSGTFDNSVGNVVEMPRNNVNEDPNQTCSYGLHVANWDYARNFSNGLMIQVKVNPADVVAVPVDYNSAKMRVCKYVVMAVVENPSDALYIDTSISDDLESSETEENEDENSDSSCNSCGDPCSACEDEFDEKEDDEDENW